VSAPDADPGWPDLLYWLGRPASVGETVRVETEEAHHLLRVTRRRAGDRITLADGCGGWIDGELLDAPRGVAEVRVDGLRPAPTEPRHPCILALPPLRSGRTELVLEKGTELGVTAFVPLVTARARPGTVREGRLERVLRTAAMQCLRSRPPELRPETPLEEWLGGLPPDVTRWAGRPGGDPDPVPPDGPRALLVGPEGDLTPEEWGRVEAAGFLPIDLGPRRLRAETAALALVIKAGLTTPRGA